MPSSQHPNSLTSQAGAVSATALAGNTRTPANSAMSTDRCHAIAVVSVGQHYTEKERDVTSSGDGCLEASVTAQISTNSYRRATSNSSAAS